MSFTPETLLRQWNTLRLLPRSPRRISATELHARLLQEGFKVGKRSVERDLHSLALIFPILSDERSKPFGWSWQKDAPLFDLAGLSNSQALTLLLAREHLKSILPASILGQLEGLFALAEQVLAQLDGRVSVASWMDKVKVIPSAQALLSPHVDETVQSNLYEALLFDKQCLLEYMGRGKAELESYPINPLGLVQRGHIIYLVCTIKTYPDIRLLALHRMHKVQVLDEPSKRPDEFDLDHYLTTGALGWFPKERIRLEVLLTKEIAQHLIESPLAEDQELQELSDGRYHLVATVMENKQLLWWLRSFGASVEVLTPLELRHVLREDARCTLRLYGE